MIHRELLIRHFNPTLKERDLRSPLTVGNGDFAFTADIPGLQTFAEDYSAGGCPLLTMASGFWHTAPDGEGHFAADTDITYTDYARPDRRVSYPTECKKGEEENYDRLRQNPHRYNLVRLSLLLDGRKVRPDEINAVRQELDLYTGVLKSCFKLEGREVSIETAVGDGLSLGVSIEARLLKDRLSVLAEFPYASPARDGGVFDRPEAHTTEVLSFETTKGHSKMCLKRTMDRDVNNVCISGQTGIKEAGDHSFTLSAAESAGAAYWFNMSFAAEGLEPAEYSFRQVKEASGKRFYLFWNRGAMINVLESADKRAEELERRLILSMYLTFVQCTATLPPQETGLTCNSWYGKFHLEMHPIHTAWLALYGRGDLLEKSLDFYVQNLGKAVELARSNGFDGARWPKMTGPDAANSPSAIAPLLIWQQPHIIYMLGLLRLARYSEKRCEVAVEDERTFLERYKEVIEKTADFMADYALYDEADGYFHLPAPMYSVQEKGDPKIINDAPFELGYWRFGLKLAYDMLSPISAAKEKWLEVSEKMAAPEIKDGLLPAYRGCGDTFTGLNTDHPSMVFAEALFDTDTDRDVLRATLAGIEEKWDFGSPWGWDFAVLAMVYARLGMYGKAFDMLLRDTGKNSYAASGNNYQADRRDLPLYLPGNGALLLEMTAVRNAPGWYIETEGIMEYPF
ncbi:MAG: glycoside hydrolase family 65 [Lachnospiraceae bacterium]|nr:glycoside hydrolase family 65 [Lachnospiraceae bacterium]